MASTLRIDLRAAAAGAATLAMIVAWMLIAVPPANAAKYSVAQCGWRAGNSGAWDDITQGSKFRGAAHCAVPAPGDSFDGAHAKSLTREGEGTVSGTRFARWRWVAPPGTAITGVHGQWWHALRNGFQHRVGTVDGGGFRALATADETRLWRDHFGSGFETPQRAFESRLLCARPEASSCALAPGSWSAVRALTLTLVDTPAPRAELSGPLLASGWRRGATEVRFSDADVGSGVQAGVTRVDGRIHASAPFECAQVTAGGETRGARMQPCAERRSGAVQLDTRRLPDGPHAVAHCAVDFAGNTGCAGPRTFLVDNHAPTTPLGLTAGGEAWRPGSLFNVAWTNPGQERGSSIAGAGYRLLGDGYDSGPIHIPGAGRSAIIGIPVPWPGTYTARVWLRDDAGNENEASAASVVVRLDDRPPGIRFERMRAGRPQVVRVSLLDRDSGAGLGVISYRRLGSQSWERMPTSLEGRVGQTTEALLTARFPAEQLAPGRYELLAEARDVAGNAAATDRQRDGSPMIVAAPLRRPTVLRSWLAAGRDRGRRLRVAFGARARVAGRLTRPNGAPLRGKLVRVTVRPAPGAGTPSRTRTVRSGTGGRFSLPLGRGPSRGVEVRYAGSARLASSGSGPLRLSVRAGVSFAAAPRTLRTGERLRMSGIVRPAGASLPAGGKRVDVEFFDSDAGRWRPVMAARTDRAGRFAASYRFRYITGTARIRLRAFVPAEGGWPFGPGFSAPVVVRVAG